MQILVTGGLGYIGSHTSVELISKGFDVVIVDDLSNSKLNVFDKIKKITGQNPNLEIKDLKNKSEVKKLFSDYRFDGIIHFAAHKSVNESVSFPEKYYKNNIGSLENLLENIDEKMHFIFSSSCTVYGQADKIPIKEDFPIKKSESPYGETKQICENILKKFCDNNPNFNNITLRYFNPIGAHSSGLIGELPLGKPENLVPFLTQTAIGKRDQLIVFGDDYNTTDGTCIRDYIHIEDLADVHVSCLEYLIQKKNKKNYEFYNVGTGEGLSVLELINLFEKVNNVKVNYKIGKRRKGDVIIAFADVSKIKQNIGWVCKHSVEDALKSSWCWEKNLRDE
ncbi:UDP-glucose 4-epimerase GalE [Flavobacteriales bacterium]|nr:UDP-glucose 4-epimerase GalE [Flavobacteriales bacterium]